MRLTPCYRETIKEVAKNVFGDNASVWLFGSRLDDTAKGGDIDVLIKLETPTPDKVLLAVRYNALLQMKLGLQKIDVLVIDPSTELKPIHQYALADAVRL
jgi:Nucleotidyltransferase domain.